MGFNSGFKGLIVTSQFVGLFCDLHHLFSEGNITFSSFCISIQLLKSKLWVTSPGSGWHIQLTLNLSHPNVLYENFSVTCIAHACSSVT